MRKLYSLLTFHRVRKSGVILSTCITLLSFNSLHAQDPSVNLAYNPAEQDRLTLPAGIVAGAPGDFTIEAWVLWNSPSSTGFERIFDFGTGTTSWMFLTPSTGGATPVARFAITTSDVPGAQVIDANIPIPTGVWTHVAVTINSVANTGSIFINGQLSGTSAITLRAADLGVTTENWLGQSRYAPIFSDPYFNGNIDELRVSNVVRYTANFTPHPTEFVNDANTLALYHFDEGVGQTTADASGNFAAAVLGDNNTVETVDPTWVTGSILPVTLIQFDAQKTGGSITLNWKASVTGDGGQFLVEHSTNGQAFQGIGTLPISNVSGTYSFAFTDASPKPGKNFYRLKIAENNATPKYSPILLVELPAKSLYAAYPSITNTTLFVKIPKATTLMIYNELGLLVKRIKLQNSQDIQVNDLSKGNYLIRFEGAGDTVRFTKL